MSGGFRFWWVWLGIQINGAGYPALFGLSTLNSKRGVLGEKSPLLTTLAVCCSQTLCYHSSMVKTHSIFAASLSLPAVFGALTAGTQTLTGMLDATGCFAPKSAGGWGYW